MSDKENVINKADHILWVQESTKKLCDKTLDFILEEVKQNKYNDTIYFATVKTLYDYVRAIMVKIHGEQAVRRQEDAIISIDPTAEWKE